MKRAAVVCIVLCVGMILSGCSPPGITQDDESDSKPKNEEIIEISDTTSDVTLKKKLPEDGKENEKTIVESNKQAFSKNISLQNGLLTIVLTALPQLPDDLVDDIMQYAQDNTLEIEIEQDDTSITLLLSGENIAASYKPIDTIITSYEPDIELPDFFVHQDDYWNNKRPSLFEREKSFPLQDWYSIEQHFIEVDRYMDEMRRQMFDFMEHQREIVPNTGLVLEQDISE